MSYSYYTYSDQKPGVVSHSSNPSTQEAKTDREMAVSARPGCFTWQVPGQPGLGKINKLISRVTKRNFDPAPFSSCPSDVTSFSTCSLTPASCSFNQFCFSILRVSWYFSSSSNFSLRTYSSLSSKSCLCKETQVSISASLSPH